MKRILLVLPMLLLFLNSKALNLTGVNPSSNTSFKAYPTTPTNLSFDFNVGTTAIQELTLFKVQIIYFNEAGDVEVIADTGYDTFFNREKNGYSWGSTITGVLAAGKTKGKIGLRLTRAYQGGLINFEDTITKYNLIDPNTSTGPAPIGGNMTRDLGDGKVYINFDGYQRHIQDAATLGGIFIKKYFINDLSQANFNYYWSQKIGPPIGPNTRLVEDTNNGQVYYQENGVLRYITSPDVAKRFQFDLKKAQKIHGTGGYTFGPDIR